MVYLKHPKLFFNNFIFFLFIHALMSVHYSSLPSLKGPCRAVAACSINISSIILSYYRSFGRLFRQKQLGLYYSTFHTLQFNSQQTHFWAQSHLHLVWDIKYFGLLPKMILFLGNKNHAATPAQMWQVYFIPLAVGSTCSVQNIHLYNTVLLFLCFYRGD